MDEHSESIKVSKDSLYKLASHTVVARAHRYDLKSVKDSHNNATIELVSLTFAGVTFELETK